MDNGIWSNDAIPPPEGGGWIVPVCLLVLFGCFLVIVGGVAHENKFHGGRGMGRCEHPNWSWWFN